MTPAQAHLVEQLRARFGAKAALTEPGAIAPWLTDWRGRWHGASPALLQPDSVEAVAAIWRSAYGSTGRFGDGPSVAAGAASRAAREGNGGRPASTRFHAPAQWPSMSSSGMPAARSESRRASSSVLAPPPHASGLRNGFAVGSPVHQTHHKKRRRFVRATA